MAIDAGANGLTVQFTPPDIESNYGLYARGSEKMEQGYFVRLGKARMVAEQTGLPLDLRQSGLGAQDDAKFSPRTECLLARGVVAALDRQAPVKRNRIEVTPVLRAERAAVE